MKPDLLDSFEYNGSTITVQWFDLKQSDQIPDVQWEQVYVVGNLGGLVPVVQHMGDRDNLPGGKTEPGETIEQTIKREVLEELNCKVTSWQPIGYQKLSSPAIDTLYQLRVCAKLEKIGEFVSDPGGAVTGYKLVDHSDFARLIGYGAVGERLTKLTSAYFK